MFAWKKILPSSTFYFLSKVLFIFYPILTKKLIKWIFDKNDNFMNGIKWASLFCLVTGLRLMVYHLSQNYQFKARGWFANLLSVPLNNFLYFLTFKGIHR